MLARALAVLGRAEERPKAPVMGWLRVARVGRGLSGCCRGLLCAVSWLGQELDAHRGFHLAPLA